MFVLSPSLLAQGSIFEILRSVITATIGVYALAAAVAGYLKGELSIVLRVVIFLSGMLLVNSGIITDLIGIGIIIAVYILQHVQSKKKGIEINDHG